MTEKQANYMVVRELIAFASGTEGDLASLKDEEVNQRLEAQGFNLEEMDKATARRLKMIRNAIAASAAAKKAQERIKKVAQPINMKEMALAARTEEAADEADLGILWKLSQPDVDDGSED